MRAEKATDVLTSYEHLVEVTSRMREAAVQDDWDRVISLESECAQLYSHLMAAADDAQPLSRARQHRKAELIMKVLEHDAQIRELLSGQLVHIWRLLDGQRSVGRLNSTYGAAASGAGHAE